MRALLLCILLMGCGGGSSPSGYAPPPQPVIPRADLLFGYFGVDASQIAETADHVNVVMVPDWGPWQDRATRDFIGDRMIAQLQEADARGVRKFVVCVGVFVFDQNYRWRGVDELLIFKAKLDALGLSDKVVALYPVDEPELHGFSDASLLPALAAIRAAWPGPKLAVTYGDGLFYPGKDGYDWIGKDNYGAGAGVLSQMPPLNPGQKHILVPGGAEPWRHDPAPFYAHANAHPEVVWIMPFVWFDGFEGKHWLGIRSNGMAALYRATGMRVKEGK